jgi:hypothetical protein
LVEAPLSLVDETGEGKLIRQSGAYLAGKNRRLARMRPRISARLDRFLSRGI